MAGVQAALTVAGFVPVIGEAANAASAIISLVQGDYAGAGMSVFAMIPFVGGIGDAAKLARLGEAAAKSAEAVGQDALRLHHAFPKYLGGPEDQLLESLPKGFHDAYHSGLDKILPRQWRTSYYQGLSGPARQQAFQDFRDYTQAFDAKYGTSLWDAAVREGFPKQ